MTYKKMFFFLAIIGCILNRPALSDSPHSSIKLNTRVIGGAFADTNQYSVAMLVSKNGNLCSGSVISRRGILTASHCAFIAQQANSVAIIKGRRYLLKSGKKAPGGVDIGIVKTSSNISAVSISVPQGVRLKVGQRFLLLGFGDPSPGQLTAGYMTIGSYISGGEEFLANAYQGENACPGDSGGPALVSYNGRVSVIGVVSRGPNGCTSGNSVIFPLTTTSTMSRWIRLNG